MDCICLKVGNSKTFQQYTLKVMHIQWLDRSVVLISCNTLWWTFSIFDWSLESISITHNYQGNINQSWLNIIFRTVFLQKYIWLFCFFLLGSHSVPTQLLILFDLFIHGPFLIGPNFQCLYMCIQQENVCLSFIFFIRLLSTLP